MKHCALCDGMARQRARCVCLVTDKRLRSPSYLQDVRKFTSNLAIPPKECADYFTNIFRDFNGFICTEEGHLVSLNMEALEVYSEWYRDWLNTPPPVGVLPRLPRRSKARIRIIATLLRIAFPDQEEGWGDSAENDR